ncbi:hypothetical protein [Singulisphaera sp. PoT]|uniref:hypothetical protein n=1 Tax=Singulisphaera sp. PoT TaxID=3411797 RepID=UPI003BF61A33
MLSPAERSLDVAEIERAVHNAEPSVRFVSPSRMRRVIKRDRRLGGYGFHLPHRHVYTVFASTDNGAAALEQAEIAYDRTDPDPLILLPRPDPRDFADFTPGTLLRDLWRLVFHAKIHAVLEGRALRGHFSYAEIQARVDRIGRDEFEEIRGVLRTEGILLPPEDDLTTFVEFAAYYLELRRFSPQLLTHTFPGLDEFERGDIEALLAGDIDDKTLFESCRPEGAWLPDTILAEGIPSVVIRYRTVAESAELEIPETRQARLSIRKSTTAANRGNDVRAAILKTSAARQAQPRFKPSFDQGAKKDLERLVHRIQETGLFEANEADEWLKGLLPLLERASRGFWTAEARLLYDLQKVCLDYERPAFRMDFWGWVNNFGKTPIRRDQPLLGAVMAENHLRRAAHRLASVHVGVEDRARLGHLLHDALDQADELLRRRLRKPIETTIEEQGFRPCNLPERVAFKKLVDELLDKISSRGHLSIGELRDACSRSNLKLPDIKSFGDAIRRDRLLQADRALARELDGIYRRGEIYLRWLHRLSAMAFATSFGRFLTLYVAIPYGGAFVALEGLQHLIEPVVHHLWDKSIHLHIQNPVSLVSLGTIALGVVNFLSFRSRFLVTVASLARLIRKSVGQVVTLVFRLPLIRLLIEGRVTLYAWNYVIKPILVLLPIATVVHLLGVDDRLTVVSGGLAFLAINLLINSKSGRHLEEFLTDEVARGWRYTIRDLIPGLFRLVMASFDRVLETVDRLLYAVDEWLRFRAGQSKVSLVAKVVLSSIWFVVAYLIRIYVNLLIEPQINPIKHFPVVTVSHKVILPFSLKLAYIIATPLSPFLGLVAANFIAGITVLLFPGVFGFLVWEFKENWRLYEANRSTNLAKVIVGHHGETMARLLRPGFHSGTIPKLFSKLRKSERRGPSKVQEERAITLGERLHHVEVELHRFLTRDFIALVNESRTLKPLEMTIGSIRIATNRIKVSLHIDDEPEELTIMFEERFGHLIAGVVDPGWIAEITDAERRALITAVVGLYKMAGVELVRQPARLGEDNPSHRDSDVELHPIKDVAISWKRWVDAWERDQEGEGHPPRFVVGIPFLPAPVPPKGRGKNRRTSRR